MSALHAIRVEGGIVPSTLFQRIQADEIGTAASRQPSSYHLVGRESIRDAANRSWSYLTGAWEAWRTAQAKEPAGYDSTSAALARDRWLLVLLAELGYGRVPTTTGGIRVEGTDDAYPISHAWQHLPMHLLGPGVDLDRRNPGVQGATRSPQAMVQELLNRSDDHLWAILSNGHRLRLLRDSTALAGSAFVEFDLEAIFDGELFSEFLLLWQTCHVSRLEIPPGGDEASPADCWLEKWRSDAVRAGARALNRLRAGVEQAIGHLGTGFLAHPDNTRLREELRNGRLAAAGYHRHLLRLVYRLIFLFVTEDRGVLLDPSADEAARTRYRDYLSTQRLRRQARARHGSPAYADLWQAQRLVLRGLGGDGEPALGLPALGGLFDPEEGQGEPLLASELDNEAFLEAVRDLAWIAAGQERVQPVDYRNLDAEELGSVYEALLELVPHVSVEEHRFSLATLSGNERKTTGSYYTPSALVSALLDSALDPVIDGAVRGAGDAVEAERRLLALTVCDPACGSGHFLVAAARRIARRVAALRSGEDEPTPDDVRHALRDVVGRCVYGVDMNPLAAELAKVSLWLEAIEPGKALGFLDARIRVGNSLLSATPTLLASGVPDDAFKPLEGDDKKVAGAVFKRNRAERGTASGGQDMLELDLGDGNTTSLAGEREAFVELYDDAAAVRQQRRQWREYTESARYIRRKVHADAWAAAFAWPLVTTEDAGHAPTSAVLRRLESDPEGAGLATTRARVERLAAEYRYFHWHLEFPEVFERSTGIVGPAGWAGGFDCMLGNPPWEHIELKEQEYFAARDPEIAAATGSKRKKMISALAVDDPPLDRQYRADRRRINVLRSFAAGSGLYPLTGRGRVKTDSVFAELFRTLTASQGQTGVIVPTGIATDSTTQHFFRDLVETKEIAALYDFENAAPIFDGVHRSFKFCLLTMNGRDLPARAAAFAFFLHDPRDIESRRFVLTPEEIILLNPNTGTLPIFRTRRDAEITLGIYERVPVLVDEKKVAAGDPGGNPWDVSFMQGLFNMTSDSGLFRTRDELESEGWILQGNVFVRPEVGAETHAADDAQDRYLPLYESKMLHHFDDRWATYEADGSIHEVGVSQKRNPEFAAMPRYWVGQSNVDAAAASNADLITGWRKICRATDERTLISFGFPRAGLGDSANAILTDRSDAWLLTMSVASFVVDYVARQKVGGTNFNFFHMAQMPVPAPRRFATSQAGGKDWYAARSLELTYTSFSMTSAAVGFGDGGAPFDWLPERRDLLRAEIDAATFHLYGVERDDVDYIMETFPIVRRKDEAAYGEYRTKRLILEVYDAMQHAIDTGTEYQTILDPPPGQGPRHLARSAGTEG
ncbi:Eco57I restriction-modification methylase domain-containing protein [Isoptericola sediminis]|uniref:site-specific DNA-methyltransferase (adenine-specific) n=1 Tax=Isoptericola sediminis TaxID=2733572 RepID=A0A849K4I5_9MICO|nr:DNA methyltransferase [Isoptericola sediminis]NNU27310.1 N-6 DNA methylase [Isoptericola sediminis]